MQKCSYFVAVRVVRYKFLFFLFVGVSRSPISSSSKKEEIILNNNLKSWFHFATWIMGLNLIQH